MSTQVDSGTGKPYLVPFPASEGEAAPSSVIGTLATAHGAAGVTVTDYVNAEAALATDPMLSPEGKATKARATVVELETRLGKFTPMLETAEKKLAEGRAALMRASAKPYDPLRAMSIGAWLRDTKREERGRVIARAIELADMETISAALNSPLVWEAFPDPRWRERATRALLESSDAAKLAELDRLATAIQSVKEAHGAAKTWIRRRAGIETNADLNKKKENKSGAH